MQTIFQRSLWGKYGEFIRKQILEEFINFSGNRCLDICPRVCDMLVMRVSIWVNCFINIRCTFFRRLGYGFDRRMGNVMIWVVTTNLFIYPKDLYTDAWMADFWQNNTSVAQTQ